MNQQRDIFWDVIKGIAIMLMVFGHAIEYGSGLEYRESVAYFDSRVFQAIYAFHMPLFMFVSGYFFHVTLARKSISQTIKDKLRALLIPIVSFAIITFLLFRIDASAGFRDNFVVFASTFVDTLWFLWSLLICCSIVIVAKVLNADHLLTLFVILLLLLLVPGSWFAPHVFMYPYFVSGYLLKKHNVVMHLDNYKMPVALVSIIIFILLFIWFDSHTLIYTSGTCVFGNRPVAGQLLIDAHRWAIGFAGVAFVYSMVRFIAAIPWMSKMNRAVAMLGRRSMGIYCFNAIICAVYFHFTRDFLHPSFVFQLIGFIIMLVSGLLTTIICEIIKPLRICLLGGR